MRLRRHRMSRPGGAVLRVALSDDGGQRRGRAGRGRALLRHRHRL